MVIYAVQTKFNSKGSVSFAVVADNRVSCAFAGVYKCIKSCAQFGLPSLNEMLTAYGRTKCLMAGVVFAKLAKFGYPEDLTTRLHAALASANFLSAMFNCSLTHPQVCYAFQIPSTNFKVR